MMNNNLLKILKEFDSVTLLEFKNYLKDNLMNICCAKGSNAKIINQNINDVKLCPCCKNRMSKNGNSKTGVQKYIYSNTECKFTLSETTGTVTYYSKKPFEVWKNIIDNLINGLSLQRIADKNHISKTTSFNMRHKILNALCLFMKKIFLSGYAQCDEKYFKINLKGTRPDKMPRFSKKRTSSGTVGISKHDICVLSVANDKGNNLAEINGIHSQLETWLARFHGVSTRHLQEYLNWFAYVYMMKKRFEKDKLEVEMYRNIILSADFIESKKISTKEMPIDLYEAYGNYKYGIFAN